MDARRYGPQGRNVKALIDHVIGLPLARTRELDAARTAGIHDEDFMRRRNAARVAACRVARNHGRSIAARWAQDDIWYDGAADAVYALVIRDLIGTDPGWTWAEYATLTEWLRSIGIIVHPDDAAVPELVTV